MSKPKIIIHLEGGLVQEVRAENLSCGIEVEVRDYDTEGADPEELVKDDQAKEHLPRVWDMGKGKGNSTDKALLRQLLRSYRDTVVFYREEWSRIGRGEPASDPEINRPDCSDVVLRTYRLAIRTMLGMEE